MVAMERFLVVTRSTDSVMKEKPPGLEKKVRTHENIERVRQTLVRSPARSARRHAAKLNISRELVRRIFQRDLRVHPYKIVVVQELKARDCAA